MTLTTGDVVRTFLRDGTPFCPQLLAAKFGVPERNVPAAISDLRRKKRWQIDSMIMTCDYGERTHYVLIYEPGTVGPAAKAAKDLVPTSNGLATNGQAAPASATAAPVLMPGAWPDLDESLVVCALIRREDGTVELGLRGDGRTWHVEVRGHT